MGWPSKSGISVAGDGKTLIVFKPRDETVGFVFQKDLSECTLEDG